MTSIQHLDDIEIPDIEIDSGWPVSDVLTIEDCEDAFAFLQAAIATIEFDIELETEALSARGPLWLAKARCALKYKKAAVTIIHNKRQRFLTAERRAFLERKDRLLLDYIARSVPPEKFELWVLNSGCEARSLEEAA